MIRRLKNFYNYDYEMNEGVVLTNLESIERLFTEEDSEERINPSIKQLKAMAMYIRETKEYYVPFFGYEEYTEKVIDLILNKDETEITKLEFLNEIKDMISHNIMCYSSNYSLEQSKQGYEKEFIRENKKLMLVEQMIKEEKQKENGKGHYILIGLVIGIPLLMVVAALLLSADAVFASLVSRFFGELAWSDFITVFLMLVLVYLFAYGFIRGLLTKSLTGKRRECLGEPLAAITVLSLLTAIYAVFCTIQIVYLFLRAGTLPEQMTWAQYARQGFFQLLAVCVINLAVVAVCLFGFRKNRALQILLTAVCAMTYVLIASSAWRMYLYIRQYSLTFLRLMVLWALLVMAVIFAGTMIAVWKRDFELPRFWLIAVAFLYLIPAFGRPDYWIASYNVSREANTRESVMYSKDADDALPTAADYSYLRGLSADAAPVLIGRKDLTGDAVPWMHAYEEDQRSETKNLGIRNFNLSLWQAKRRLSQG